MATCLGYHRILSHRSLTLPKVLERCLITIALPAGTPVQWIGNHRYHHAHADEIVDPHSPIQEGFWYAHVGWYIGTSNSWACFFYSLAGPCRTLLDGWIRPRTNQQYNHLSQDIARDGYYALVSRPDIFLLACITHVIAVFLTAYWFWG